MISGIYTITNRLNGKIYVGCTVNFYNRVKLHKKQLSLNKHENCYLQNVYNKYGDIFDFEILEECDRELLPALEHYWVNLLNSRKNGYNLRLTDPNGRIVISEETRKKMSEYNKKIGRVPPSRKGTKMSEENIEKMRILKTGRKHSLETRLKMSRIHKERWKKMN